jgi:hypothetical protein
MTTLPAAPVGAGRGLPEANHEGDTVTTTETTPDIPQCARCKHPADEHSVYGCFDDCGCPERPDLPAKPDVIVQATRYEVSLLPLGDINRRDFALYVERTRRGTWIVHDGHGGYDSDGNWAAGLASGDDFQDRDDAETLARRLAPTINVNGITAVEALRRTPVAPGGGR